MRQVHFMAITSAKTRIALLGLAVATIATSCAWIDPHPRARELYEFKYDSTPRTFTGTLPNAIDAANAQRAAYAAHAREQSILRSATAVGVGAASVTALYLGITSQHPDAITALGLAGASALGLSSYFDSRPRQRLYYAASRTVGCAVAAMTPFLIPESEFKDFIDALTNLGKETADVETAVSDVENATATAHDDASRDFLALAKAQAASGRLLLERANGILREGNRLKSLVERAGPTLRNNVLDIVDKVDEEITKTESDPQALVALLSGLQSLSKQITRVAPVGGETKEAEGSPAAKTVMERGTVNAKNLVKNLQGSLKRLQTATVKMIRLTVPVSALVNQVAAAKEQVQDIRSCQPPETQTNFAVVPDEDVREVQAPSTFSFLVTGNVNAPRAHLTNQSAADATVDIRVKGGIHEVEVVIGKNAKTVDAVLMIQNGNEVGRKVITLRIKEAPKTEIDKATERKTGLKLTAEEFTTLQWVIGLRQTNDKTNKDRIDGVDGSITRDAIRKYKEDDKSLGAGDGIDKEFIAVIEARNRAPLPNPSLPDSLRPLTDDPQNDYEQTLLKDDSAKLNLKTIQQKLANLGFSAKVTGKYDEDLRKAVIAFQNSQSRRPTGILGQLLVAAIENARPKVDKTAPADTKLAPSLVMGPKNEFEKALSTTAKDCEDFRKNLANALSKEKIAIPQDCKFGQDMRTAIMAYEKLKQLPVTGLVSPELLKNLGM